MLDASKNEPPQRRQINEEVRSEPFPKVNGPLLPEDFPPAEFTSAEAAARAVGDYMTGRRAVLLIGQAVMDAASMRDGLVWVDEVGRLLKQRAAARYNIPPNRYDAVVEEASRTGLVPADFRIAQPLAPLRHPVQGDPPLPAFRRWLLRWALTGRPVGR